MNKPIGLRKALFPEGITDEERMAARYRSELKAEIQLREDAEERAKEAERRMEMAHKVAIEPLLAAERQAREAAERHAQDISKELDSLRTELSAVRTQLSSMSQKNEHMEKLYAEVMKIDGTLKSLPTADSLKDMESRLSKVKRETLTLPQKLPPQLPPAPVVIPSFQFKPVHDHEGRIVSVTATPIKGG